MSLIENLETRRVLSAAATAALLPEGEICQAIVVDAVPSEGSDVVETSPDSTDVVPGEDGIAVDGGPNVFFELNPDAVGDPSADGAIALDDLAFTDFVPNIFFTLNPDATGTGEAEPAVTEDGSAPVDPATDVPAEVVDAPADGSVADGAIDGATEVTEDGTVDLALTDFVPNIYFMLNPDATGTGEAEPAVIEDGSAPVDPATDVPAEVVDVPVDGSVTDIATGVADDGTVNFTCTDYLPGTFFDLNPEVSGETANEPVDETPATDTEVVDSGEVAVDPTGDVTDLATDGDVTAPVVDGQIEDFNVIFYNMLPPEASQRDINLPAAESQNDPAPAESPVVPVVPVTQPTQQGHGKDDSSDNSGPSLVSQVL